MATSTSQQAGTQGSSPGPKQPFQRTAPDIPKRANPNLSNISEDRGHQIKRDDKVKNHYIGLYDIDECIQYYFDNVIKPSVDDGDEYVRVPMIYGSPERWVSVQKNGFFRDQQGKIQIPVIIYRRTSVAKNRTMSNKLDANNPHFHYTFQKQYNKRNRYDNFAAVNGITPSTENYNIVIPDFVTLTYECIIWTEYVEQMNKIIESVNYAEDAYWGDPEKFKFRTLIEDFSQETELEADADRTVRTSFTIMMEGYVIPDALNKELQQGSIKTFGPTKTIFNTRAVVEHNGQLAEIAEFTSPYTDPNPSNVITDPDGTIDFNRFDGADYTVSSPLTVAAGVEWLIDGTLTVDSTINNYGTIRMGALVNNGTINNINSGTVIVSGVVQ